MSMPLDYIILDIMLTLKENKKETKISKDKLVMYLKRLINLLEFEPEALEDMIFEFDFVSELAFFLEDNEDYFEMDDNGNIIFDENASLEELKDLIKKAGAKNFYDMEFIYDIHDIINSNSCFLNILDIKINTDIYDTILRIEEELESEYLELSYRDAFSEMRSFISSKRVKILKTLINTMYINIDNNLNETEQRNLILYATDNAKSMQGEMGQIKLLYSPEFDYSFLLDDPMNRALFLNESVSKYALKDRMKNNLKKKKKVFSINDISKINFCLELLRLLDKEIDNVRNEELRDELIFSKYRFMYALDSTYDLMNYDQEEEAININGNYELMASISYFFVKEILSYNDEEYKLEGTNQKDIVTYYFNIIKKLYIEAYYNLTKDEKLINMIKKNGFYMRNRISTKLFNSFVPLNEEEKRKIKKRRYI